MRRVISSTRPRASGGSDAILNASRSSSDRRICSACWRRATTVGIAPSDLNQLAEFLDLLADDPFGAIDLARAPGEVFVHRELQVVDVIEEHLLDCRGSGLHVARHRDVDDEQRTAASRAHYRFDAPLGENGLGGCPWP